jgi:hypothetical protein
MANTLPITFSVAPLPPNFRGNPNQLSEAIAARLSIDSIESISFFVTGSIAPTSDVGPWLKNGTTWYVWDNGVGAYVPQPLEFESIKYTTEAIANVTSTNPDPQKYVFFIELDGSGKAIDIMYFSTGGWHSIFEDKFALYSTTTEMNSAIAAGLATLQQYPFRVDIDAAITFTFPTAPDTQRQTITFNVTFDPNSVWSEPDNAFVVPVNGYYQISGIVHFTTASGDATGITRQINLLRNGSYFDVVFQSQGSTTSQQLIPWSTNVQLNAGDKIQVEAMVSVDAIVTGPYVAEISSNNSPFTGFLIQKS